MLEWDDVTRHWWRYDKERVALVHRASGETIIYRGPMGEEAWHRFDYEHEGVLYPLAVQMRRVSYPNPRPERWSFPPWNAGSTPILRPWTWRVDHERSRKLWQQASVETQEMPPYWLWRRVDIAILEAALLWPRKTAVGEPADEVSVNAGWENGVWTGEFYRRFYLPDPLQMFGYRLPSTIHCLPLSDHALTPLNAQPQQWTSVEDSAFDGFGKMICGRARVMRNATGDIRVGNPVEPQRDSNVDRPEAHALTVLWAGLYITTAVSCATTLVLPTEYKAQFVPSAIWYCGPTGRTALGWIGNSPNADTEIWLGRPLKASDRYFKRVEDWHHDLVAVDRVSSSYRLWKAIYEICAGALPRCPGFEGNAGDIQGNIGTVMMHGGFVAGIHYLQAEIRLKLRVDTDPPDFDWHRFF